MKIVINRQHGGFDLSEAAMQEYCQRTGLSTIERWEIARDDPVLVELVETMPDAAGKYSTLKVVEVPNDVDWVIEEYDGLEWIAERHRTWS